jgi:hypothetical protein
VHLDKGSADCLGDITLPLTVKSLKLHGSLDILPGGIDKLSKLTKLDLVVTILNQSDIQLLGELPKLTILRLHLKPVDEGNLNFCILVNGLESESHYKKVRVLEIACSSSLHVKFGRKTMANLEVLKTVYCTGPLELSGLSHLKTRVDRPIVHLD